jgi:hypothetical protein
LADAGEEGAAAEPEADEGIEEEGDDAEEGVADDNEESDGDDEEVIPADAELADRPRVLGNWMPNPLQRGLLLNYVADQHNIDVEARQLEEDEE